MEILYYNGLLLTWSPHLNLVLGSIGKCIGRGRLRSYRGTTGTCNQLISLPSPVPACWVADLPILLASVSRGVQVCWWFGRESREVDLQEQRRAFISLILLDGVLGI